MRSRTTKVLAISAVVPTLLILSACRADMAIEIKDNGAANVVLEFEDSTGELEGLGLTCDDLFSDLGMDDPLDTDVEEEVTIEDISGEYLACRMTTSTTESVVDGESLIDNGDTFTFVAEADPTMVEEEMPVGMEFDFTLTIQMPGEIIEATNGGVIDGNRATYDAFEAFTTGFEVTGNKAGGGQAADTDSDEVIAPAPDDSDFPVWGWILIGVGALALIGIVAYLLSRRNKDQGGQGPYGPGGPYPPQGGQYAGPTSAFGVPQAGQHNAPGGQFQTPQGGYQQGGYPGQQDGYQQGGAGNPDTNYQGGQSRDAGQGGWNEGQNRQDPTDRYRGGPSGQ
ncbi:hypothetical protein [Flaviflexus huanghaiensis]|uniref:hypothetical protein n=1 Tax=Flaviflexus huanghaiensis TaxID=1111473 RepID=UPI0015F98844|nr:hypothetical protein [Flaviflexus huanghaiensis]